MNGVEVMKIFHCCVFFFFLFTTKHYLLLMHQELLFINLVNLRLVAIKPHKRDYF